MSNKRYPAKHITTSDTTNMMAVSCYVNAIVVTCSDAGTSWTLKIQDQASTPKILVPPFELIVPADGLPNVNVEFKSPQRAEGGIDVVTAGGAPGAVDVQIGCTTADG